MTHESIAKKALNSGTVKKLLERLSSQEREYVETFASRLAGLAEDAITRSHDAMTGEIPTNGISDGKVVKDGV